MIQNGYCRNNEGASNTVVLSFQGPSPIEAGVLAVVLNMLFLLIVLQMLIKGVS